MKIFLFFYLPPFIAIAFFITCVSIAQKIRKGQNVTNQTFAGALMFSFLLFAVMWLISTF